MPPGAHLEARQADGIIWRRLSTWPHDAARPSFKGHSTCKQSKQFLGPQLQDLSENFGLPVRQHVLPDCLDLDLPCLKSSFRLFRGRGPLTFSPLQPCHVLTACSGHPFCPPAGVRASPDLRHTVVKTANILIAEIACRGSTDSFALF